MMSGVLIVGVQQEPADLSNMQGYIYTWVCVCDDLCVCTLCIYIYVYIYIRIYIYISIYINIYIYIYIWTQFRVWPNLMSILYLLVQLLVESGS